MAFQWGEQERLIAAFYSWVVGVTETKDPFLRSREELGSTAVAFAGLQVLSLKPGERIDIILDGLRFISGGLRQRVGDCAKHNLEMEDYVCCKKDASDAEMIDFATFDRQFIDTV